MSNVEYVRDMASGVVSKLVDGATVEESDSVEFQAAWYEQQHPDGVVVRARDLTAAIVESEDAGIAVSKMNQLADQFEASGLSPNAAMRKAADILEDDDGVVDMSEWMKQKERETQKRTQANRMVSISETRMTQLMKSRHMLAAATRGQGRLRISREDLEKVNPRDKLDVKVQENGDLVVTFVEG